MMKIPFDSDKAKELNKEIFEAIYFGACTASCNLAKDDGTYETYPGSPASEGKLQFDLWNIKPVNDYDWKVCLKARYNQYKIWLMVY